MDDDSQPQYQRGIDDNARALATIQLHGGTLRGYCPGRLLCEYLVPGNVEHLDGIEFYDGYDEQIPAHFAEAVDTVIIDWLTKRANSETADSRLQAVIRELQAFGSSQLPEAQEMVDLCVDSLESLRKETLPSEAERQFALQEIKALRRSLAIPETGPDNPTR
jgi:hypothetical protein